MRRIRFTAIAFAIGATLFAWSALPWEELQGPFFVFLLFWGPSIVFSVAIAVYIILRSKKYRAVWLLLLGPLIYYGVIMVITEARDWVDPFYIAGILGAWAFLAVTSLLLYRTLVVSAVFGWGSLSAIAVLPFLPWAASLGDGWLGRLWPFGLHTFLWYVAVAYALDMMANNRFNTDAMQAARTTRPLDGAG